MKELKYNHIIDKGYNMTTADRILTIKLNIAIPPSGRIVTFNRDMLTKASTKNAKEQPTQVGPKLILGKQVYYSDECYYPDLPCDKMIEFLFNKDKFNEIINAQPKADKTTELEKIQKHNITATTIL